MKDFILKTFIPTAVAIFTAIGAFSIQINYERGQHQSKMGELAVILTRGCNDNRGH